MDVIVICLVALIASGLTLFSGFGLGTLLLPAFLVFFPAEIAVGLTAIVHLLNNFFKLAVLGKHADLRIVLRFGLPAIVAAIGGASLLFLLVEAAPVLRYDFLGRVHAITLVNLLIGLLVFGFALIELLPSFDKLQIDPKYLPMGGALSGFFGGLSGHQGALRSAFLIHAGLTKEAFIGTGVAIACLIDITRIAFYANHLQMSIVEQNLLLLGGATLSAFVGVFAGNRLVKKVTMRTIQLIVAALLFVVAVGLGSGLLS